MKQCYIVFNHSKRSEAMFIRWPFPMQLLSCWVLFSTLHTLVFNCILNWFFQELQCYITPWLCQYSRSLDYIASSPDSTCHVVIKIIGSNMYCHCLWFMLLIWNNYLFWVEARVRNYPCWMGALKFKMAGMCLGGSAIFKVPRPKLRSSTWNKYEVIHYSSMQFSRKGGNKLENEGHWV